MAVTTYTSTVFANNGPRGSVYGLTEVRGNMVHSGTVGDILFLAKVPNGAKIVDFHEYHTSGQTAAAYSFGFDRGIASGGAGNLSCLVSSGAIATENRLQLAAAPSMVPVTISLSDTDPVLYATLSAKAESGTFTISVSIAFVLIYRADDTTA